MLSEELNHSMDDPNTILLSNSNLNNSMDDPNTILLSNSNLNNSIDDPNTILLSNSNEYCRYCFEKIDKNFSACLCQSILCQSCLEKELIMSSERTGQNLKCTDCYKEYKIKKDKKSVSFSQIKQYVREKICPCSGNAYLHYELIDVQRYITRFGMWFIMLSINIWQVTSPIIAYFVNYELLEILYKIIGYDKFPSFYYLKLFSLIFWICMVCGACIVDTCIHIAQLQFQKFLNYPFISLNILCAILRINCIGIFWGLYIQFHYGNTINHITSIMYMVLFLCTSMFHIIISLVICWAKAKVELSHSENYFVNESGPLQFSEFDPQDITTMDVEDNILNTFRVHNFE